MEIVMITMQQIIKMFLLILVGVLCYKVKILDSAKSKTLSDLLLKIVTPALIFSSFQTDFEFDLVKGFLISIGLTAVSLGLACLLAHVFVRPKENFDLRVERFASMFNNCGFMGIPLAYGIFGSEGVFYIVGYNLLFDLIVFSIGETYMKGQKAAGVVDVLKQMINPATIASIVGVLCFVFQIRMPELIEAPIEMVADMNTPLAMMAAGVSVARSDFGKILKKGRLFYVSAVRLLIIPIIYTLLLKFFPIPDTVYMTCVLAAACPAGTLAVIYSVMYNRDDVYGSEIFSITTILSIITIPLVVAIAAF